MDATALRRGGSRSELGATNVRLHATSAWHLKVFLASYGSGEREVPRDKPVASFDFLGPAAQDTSLLEKATERDLQLQTLNVDHGFDNIPYDPRFQDLMRVGPPLNLSRSDSNFL